MAECEEYGIQSLNGPLLGKLIAELQRQVTLAVELVLRGLSAHLRNPFPAERSVCVNRRAARDLGSDGFLFSAILGDVLLSTQIGSTSRGEYRAASDELRARNSSS